MSSSSYSSYSFFLHLFGPSRVRHLLCCLPAVTLRPAGVQRCLILTNLAAYFRTSSSHLFPTFPPGIPRPKFPSRICDSLVEHPYYVPSPLLSFNVQIR